METYDVPASVFAALWIADSTISKWEDALEESSSPWFRRAALAGKCRAMLNHDRILCGEVLTRGLVQPEGGE